MMLVDERGRQLQVWDLAALGVIAGGVVVDDECEQARDDQTEVTA